jgi:hypothetical protein
LNPCVGLMFGRSLHVLFPPRQRMIDRPDIEKLDKLPATGADEHGSGGGGHSMITSRASWLHVMENSPSIRTSIVRSITNEGHNWVKVLRSKRRILGFCRKFRSASSAVVTIVAGAFDMTIRLHDKMHRRPHEKSWAGTERRSLNCTVAISSAFLIADPSHLNDTPSIR